jgi:DNA-binding transcriptional regulator YiaG
VTPSDLRATRESLGLTQGSAARLIGVDGRTWRRWENGERGIPEPVARLVVLMGMYSVRDALDAYATNQSEELTQ